MSVKYISGNQAVAEAVKLSRVDVVAAYPITPQTSIVEMIASSIASGGLKAEMVHVEGEHSAMNACAGAAVVGARAFTATCGQGLAFMQEPVFWVAGLRLPIVMAVTNRSLLAPNTIFSDHQDSLSQRDSGWLQLYVESCQEALDCILIAYRVAEDPRVLLPVMVCLDGFFLSHLYEPVDIPTEDQATEFLPPKTVSYPILDTKDPKLLNVLVPPEYYAEFEYDKHQSMLRGLDVVEEVYADFEKQIGRKYESLEAEELHDAEYVLICMGSMSGAVRSVVRELRSLGHRVGMVKVRVFRPFPTRQLSELLRNAKAVGILDRDISFGSSGVLYQEVVRCLYGTPTAPTLINYVVGLGGRDINPSTIHKAFTDLEERSQNHPLNNGTIENSPVWLDLNLSLIESWDLEK